MKRICLAMGTIALAGAAGAQSTVALYGLVDTYVEAAKVGGASVNRVTSGGLQGSRWGMRGSEDLGDGLSAVFNLEAGISADTGALGQGGLAFGRQSFVGLAGRWGQILLGRQYAPIFTTQFLSDADEYSTFSIPATLGNYNAATLRQDNMVKYVLPKLGPVTGQLSFAPGEVAGNSGTARKLGAHFGVEAGPAILVAGYNDDNINSATVGHRRSYALGAKATFGAYALTANYFNDFTHNKTSTDLTLKTWSLGATAQLARNMRAIAQFGRVRSDRFAGASERAWLVGGEYQFSRRTDVYLRYAHVKDNKDATTTSWYGLGDVPANSRNSTLAIGIRHKF